MSALSRRHFLAATAIGFGGLTALPASRLWAAVPHQSLSIVTRTLEINGKPAKVYGLMGPDGRPGLAFNAGDRFRVRLDNRLTEASLIHWHGLTPPNAADGVPDMTQPPLPAGNSYDYDFPLARPGTNFMHSHLGLQEQNLLAAPLIIRDPAEAHLDEQEVIVLLHDFTFRNPRDILAELQNGMSHGGMDNDAMGHDMSQMEMSHDMPGMQMNGMPMGQMDMSQMAMSHGTSHGTSMDLNDVRFDAFLANDRTLDDPEVVPVERGGRVRLRLINAAAASNFMIDLGALRGQLIAVDGMPVQPMTESRFALAIGQRLDLRLDLPRETGAWPILAQLEGERARTGIMLASKGVATFRLGNKADQPIGRIDALPGPLAVASQPLAARPADRRLTLDLTGDMMRYQWGLGSAPLTVKQGERVEIEMINRTAMSHPMHLHGHHFQILAVDGKPVDGPVRDTHLVSAGGRVTIAFDAANPGRWALHCHNLYHMVAGMMTELRYA